MDAKKVVFWGILLALLFFLRFQFLPKLSLKNGEKVRITGILRQQPQIFGNQQSFWLGRIKIITEKFPEYHYQDELQVTGKIKVKNNNYQIDYPKIIVEHPPLAERTKNFRALAIELKEKLKYLFVRWFPAPFDGMVAGIVLGEKSLLPSDFWSKMRDTGTLHIMVASGMNIAMITEGFLSFLALVFRRKLAILFLFVLIWFYAFMTGFQPPIVRATIMAFLVYFGQVLGRDVSVGKILFFAGLVMIFADPFLLRDVGFQLSFLATFGLVFLQPKIQGIEFFLFKNANFSSSLAAQISTLPVLMLNFGRLNLLSPLINFAILWSIPFVLQAGIVIGLLGLIGEGLGQVFSFLLYPLLFYLKMVIDIFSKITWFRLNIF